jgi:hypothetical protein
MKTLIPTGRVIIIILLLVTLVGLVQANQLNAPESIKICGYITYSDEIGIWWVNPQDIDYTGTQIWFDDGYLGEQAPTVQGFYNIHTTVIGNHTFSTHTVDSWGNVNATWINITIELLEVPGYTENWFCSNEEWCGLTPTGNFSVRADVGETWIKYYWSTCYNVTVDIDGITQITNPVFHNYYLPGLNGNEKHQIKIYNLTNQSELLGSLSVTTLYPLGLIIILLCILIVFVIVLLAFVSDPIKILLVGGMTIPLSIYTTQVAIGYGAIMVLPFITLIVSGIISAYALWTIIIEKTRW